MGVLVFVAGKLVGGNSLYGGVADGLELGHIFLGD
jgi:hypothetical protein